MNPFIVKSSQGKLLMDPRYGSVIALGVPGSAPLSKLDVAYAVVRPGAASPPHYHEKTEEVYAIVKGDAIATVDGISTQVVPGDIVRIPCFTVHSIAAGENGVEFWVSTTPPYTDGDDIEVETQTVEHPLRSSGGIAVIVGTHRRESVSAKVARQIVGMYEDSGVPADLIDPAELPIELFGPDSFEHRYDTGSQLAGRLIAARGLHVVVPEYNGSFPGVLKHLLDVQNYEQCFGGKSVALVGIAAGDWGGLRAVDQIAAVFQYRNANVFGKRVYVRNVDESPLDDKGYLSERDILDRLRAQVTGFADFVRRLSD